MRILDWNSLDELGRRDALRRPQFHLGADVQRLVREVIERVRSDGDAAVRTFTERFDKVWLESSAVTPAEFTAARRRLTPAQIAALERAMANLERFHEKQVLKPFALETETG